MRFDRPQAIIRLLIASACLFFTLNASIANASDLPVALQDLVDEALKGNHEILNLQSRIQALKNRSRAVEALPDPMVMFGYQNEGTSKYTYGDMQGSQWMGAITQTFPYPGKLDLKSEMVLREADIVAASLDAVKVKLVARVRELYLDLLLAYKNLDLLNQRAKLLTKVEDAALSRYSTGMGTQRDLNMAQTEKYMLMERQMMLVQKVESLESMINSLLAREPSTAIAKPSELVATVFPYSYDALVKLAMESSPEIREKELMIKSASTRVRAAEREYYPDLTLSANVATRPDPYENMVSLTTTISLPIFNKKYKSYAVMDEEGSRLAAEHDLEGVKNMIAASIRDNYSMLRTTEKLMSLYKDAIQSKTMLDVETSMSGYTSGKGESQDVVGRLKAHVENENLYWTQFVEREKAIARLDALIGRPGVR